MARSAPARRALLVLGVNYPLTLAAGLNDPAAVVVRQSPVASLASLMADANPAIFNKTVSSRSSPAMVFIPISSTSFVIRDCNAFIPQHGGGCLGSNVGHHRGELPLDAVLAHVTLRSPHEAPVNSLEEAVLQLGDFPANLSQQGVVLQSHIRADEPCD